MSYPRTIPFTIPATTVAYWMFPGGFLSTAGKVVIASGKIHRVVLGFNSAMDNAVLSIYHGSDGAGMPIRSTGNRAYELGVTGANGIIDSQFECFGTAIGAGATFDAQNLVARYQIDYAGGNDMAVIDVDTDLMTGLVIGFTAAIAPAADVNLTVTYTPHKLGKQRLNEAINQFAQLNS